MTLQEFIAQAHRATYASGNSPETLTDGGKQFVFKLDDFEYIDTYFGSDNFIGTEVVKKYGRVVWGMSYYGQANSESIATKEVFSFLQKMLSKTKPGILLRGPKTWKQKEWSYRYKYKGSLNNFSAEEVIKYKGKKVHQAYFRGGKIES